MTCRLQEARPRAPCALAAQITRVVALRALAALGLSDTPFHEPFHGRNAWTVLYVTFCNLAEGAALTPTTGPGSRGSDDIEQVPPCADGHRRRSGHDQLCPDQGGKFKVQPTIWGAGKKRVTSPNGGQAKYARKGQWAGRSGGCLLSSTVRVGWLRFGEFRCDGWLLAVTVLTSWFSVVAGGQWVDVDRAQCLSAVPAADHGTSAARVLHPDRGRGCLSTGAGRVSGGAAGAGGRPEVLPEDGAVLLARGDSPGRNRSRAALPRAGPRDRARPRGGTDR